MMGREGETYKALILKCVLCLSAGADHGPPRLLRQDIVVVTFNYRLGALGFLCLGVKEAQGNVGLKDQVAALYWIHRNIGYFGGNPNEITVHGTGTGAASIHLLLLSRVAEGLFHRAILESGSAITDSLITYDPIMTAITSFSDINQEINITELLRKYMSISARSLIKTIAINWNITGYTNEKTLKFKPCIERDLRFSSSLIDKDPLEVLLSGNYHQMPMMFSFTNLEGLSILDDMSILNKELHKLLPENIEIKDIALESKIEDMIKDFYFDDTSVKEPSIAQYTDYLGDTTVNYPLVKSAFLHATNDRNPVFLMEFSYEGGLNDLKIIDGLYGAKHGDILNYVFATDNLEEEDELVAIRLNTLWSNFIKFGYVLF